MHKLNEYKGPLKGQIMKNARAIKIVLLTGLMGVCIESNAFARRLDLTLDAQDLLRSGLPLPSAASVVHLEKRTGSELTELCPVTGFGIVPQRSAGDEKVSRSLRVRFKEGSAELDECIRGSACFALSAEKATSAKQNLKEFVFNGRGGSYKINIHGNEPLPSRSIECRSSAVEVMQNSQGTLTLPTSMWVLNYQREIILWDAIEKRIWFRFQFPERQRLTEKHTVVFNSEGRLLVYDNGGSFLFVDFILDKALFKSSEGLFESVTGVGGSRFAGEWQHRQSQIFSSSAKIQNSSAKLSATPFMGLSGFVHHEEFWTWGNFIGTLSGLAGQPLPLNGSLLTGSEKIGEGESEIHLAVLKSGDTADVLQYKTGATKLRVLKSNQRVDQRAGKEHFLMLGDVLYRHTADGIYTVDASHERPSNMKGFKGSVYGHAHFTVTRQTEGKSCVASIWPISTAFKGILEPEIGPLACSSVQGLAVSPWGKSVTWREGKGFKSILSTDD
ncbi:MAG: hypothetical protein EBR09_03690 [Proteobacteria bacterium]|nr:hypothetical protein [Pseudomonadota bacterium]